MKVVIIGAGLAASALVSNLRSKSKVLEISVVTACSGDQYYKPLLSEAMACNLPENKLITLDAQAFSKRHNINLYPNETVETIDAVEKIVVTSKRRMNFDKLVIAIGATPREINANPDTAPYIFNANSLGSYQKFRQCLASQSRVTVVGGGMVACEIASALAASGIKTTLIHRNELPLSQMLLPSYLNRLVEHLDALGVTRLANTKISEISMASGRLTLNTPAGEDIDADIVMNCTGLIANTSIAIKAGLQCRQGILVDGYGETNKQDIFAIGDCMEYENSLHQYVAVINSCARSLAATLCGAPQPLLLPQLPVLLKLSGMKTVILNPRSNDQWQVTSNSEGYKATSHTSDGRTTGFILQGEFLKEQAQLMLAIKRHSVALAS